MTARNKTILMYQWFDVQDPLRSAELKECIEHNLHLGFDETIIFNDSVEPLFVGEKITNVRVDRRISYRHYIDVVSDPKNLGSLVVLANTDIKLANDFLRVREFAEPRHFLCFSRYESSSGRLAEAPWCTQDVWAMIGQPIHNSVRIQCDIPLGMPGCEIRFAEMMFNVGYSVFNPCIDIQNLHLHSNQAQHKEENRIFGAYLFTPVCSLADIGRENPAQLPAPYYLAKIVPTRSFPILLA